jgi:hypothetical protein
MSSTSGRRSAAHSGDRSEAKDFARSESRRENLAAVCRGAVADLGASIRKLLPGEFQPCPKCARHEKLRENRSQAWIAPDSERATGLRVNRVEAPPIPSRCYTVRSVVRPSQYASRSLPRAQGRVARRPEDRLLSTNWSAS